MKNLLRWAGAIALALMPSLALAQAPVGKSIQAPAGYVPATAIYCDDGTGHAALCSFSSNTSTGTSAVFSRDPYVAIANGTGFNSGDHLAKITTSTPTGGSPTTFWYNDTQGTVISSPALASISQLPQTIANTAFGSNCLVVTGNQAYAVGSQQQCNMTPSGRVKVGLSSAGNIDPAAQLATTLEADIIACKYRATPVVWSDLWTGAIRCNSTGAIIVDGSAFTQPVSGIVSNVIQVTSTTDRGGLVGTTAVTLMAANAARRGWSVQNQSTSASCYVNGGATATTDYHSLSVPAGQYFEPDHHVATGAISIICTAANTPVYSREW